MENKHNKAVTIFLVVVIVLLIAGLGVMTYFVIDLNKKVNSLNTSANNQNVVENNKQDSNKIDTNTNSNSDDKNISRRNLNLNDEVVKTAYSYIPCLETTLMGSNSPYSSKLMTINNIELKNILEFGLKSLNLTDEQKGPYIEADGSETSFDDKSWYSFDASILSNKLFEMYNKQFELINFKSARYINGKYSISSGGGSAGFLINFRKIDSAYEENENLYIIDKYICTYYGADENDKMVVRIYSNSYDKNILKEIYEAEVYNHFNEPNRQEYVFSNYDNFSNKYIHTFKKNSDSKYYWYSTEPLK